MLGLAEIGNLLWHGLRRLSIRPSKSHNPYLQRIKVCHTSLPMTAHPLPIYPQPQRPLSLTLSLETSTATHKLRPICMNKIQDPNNRDTSESRRPRNPPVTTQPPIISCARYLLYQRIPFKGKPRSTSNSNTIAFYESHFTDRKNRGWVDSTPSHQVVKNTVPR